jgi:hypothetical protein
MQQGVVAREKVLRTVPLRREGMLIAATNRADILLFDLALRLFLPEAGT